METILKEGYEKILSIFYTDKSARIHLRDIARKAKLNENSTSRFLNKLEKEKILTSRKEGNLKKYWLTNNDIVYLVLTHFDVIKFNNLPRIKKNAIIYFLQEIKEKPLITILFGSTAKCISSEKSDIDLLLIVNKKVNTKEAEEYVDSQTATKINCIQITLDDFKKELKLKNDKVIQSAIKTGYPITNHIEYYRGICNERI